MKKKEIIEFWSLEAEESLRVGVAWHLFEKEDYSYSLFFGHLAVEKILKALYAKDSGQLIPRSHNLLRLAKAVEIDISDEQKQKLIRITAFNLESRYPDYKNDFRKKCTFEFTKIELDKINEVFVWLKSIL